MHFLSYHPDKPTHLKNMFFVIWLPWLVEMSWHLIQKVFPGLLHICAKFEENLPSGWRAIAIENAGAGRLILSPLSPKYKQRPLCDA